MVQSPLGSLCETPELADAVLSLLPLHALAALLATSKLLHSVVRGQPEHACMARASQPAWRQLLQAPCARAYLKQQQQMHASIQRGALSMSRLDAPCSTVSA